MAARRLAGGASALLLALLLALALDQHPPVLGVEASDAPTADAVTTVPDADADAAAAARAVSPEGRLTSNSTSAYICVGSKDCYAPAARTGWTRASKNTASTYYCRLRTGFEGDAIIGIDAKLVLPPGDRPSPALPGCVECRVVSVTLSYTCAAKRFMWDFAVETRPATGPCKRAAPHDIAVTAGKWFLLKRKTINFYDGSKAKSYCS